MSKRVEEILSWYESDNPGVLKNLRWMMDTGALAGTGKFVILPVDQGFEHGPARSFAKNAPGYDPHDHFELAIQSGCNAYAAPLGFLEAGARKYAGRIPLILKRNNSDSLYSNADPKPAVTGSVKDALRLGCAAMCAEYAMTSIAVSPSLEMPAPRAYDQTTTTRPLRLASSVSSRRSSNWRLRAPEPG